MDIDSLNKLYVKAKELELSNGVAIFVRTLPLISIKRYLDITTETWNKIKISNRAELIKVLLQDLARLATPNCQISSEQKDIIAEEVAIIVYYLFPKEALSIIRISKSKLDRVQDSEGCCRGKIIKEVQKILNENSEYITMTQNELV